MGSRSLARLGKPQQRPMLQKIIYWMGQENRS